VVVAALDLTGATTLSGGARMTNWTHEEVFDLIEAHDDYWEYGHRPEVVEAAQAWSAAKSDYTACDGARVDLEAAAEVKDRLLAETERFRQAVRERVVGPEVAAMQAEEQSPYQRAVTEQRIRKVRRRGLLHMVKPEEPER